MTEPPNRHSVVAVAARLNDSMQELKTEIAALHTYSHRTRRFFWGLAASVAFDVVLSIVVIVVAVVAVDANSMSEQNRQTQQATCESSNQSRAVTVDLWNYVLSTAEKDPQNQTPERKKRIADFRAYMQNAYAPRDCAKVGK